MLSYTCQHCPPATDSSYGMLIGKKNSLINLFILHSDLSVPPLLSFFSSPFPLLHPLFLFLIRKGEASNQPCHIKLQ